MIVTIDGPAGAGKSSISRRLADALGFAFLDTGAMYRAVALLGLRAEVDWENANQLVELARSAIIDLSGQVVLLNGEDVSEEIRTQRVTAVTRFAANNVGVREQLVQQQRTFADALDIVTEGRDQGTLVFPHAECKIYLTASPEERARRRVNDLAARGETVEFQKILQQQTARDQEDMQRDVGPLLKADDAIEVLTDGMSEEDVLQTLIKIVRRCQNA
ncbi:(d)CMP kinase [Blastopirellula marina]|uniref:Cytidylate kinase n=1 Tax=Blastopirellula marina TaxID=124 RepID=A0A2S8GBB9_9BACT|nr:(d)CMP kinase [Blastopirellula marina]PQO41752.1 (d)CMP kinase [Blastopirellula marina]PTL46195.1 (d)CMP kinase [Blastopirellula marina]